MKDYQTEMMQKQIAYAIESLQKAIKICDNVDDRSGECEKSYAYAAGYSRSAMNNVMCDLENVVKMFSEV